MWEKGELRAIRWAIIYSGVLCAGCAILWLAVGFYPISTDMETLSVISHRIGLRYDTCRKCNVITEYLRIVQFRNLIK